MSAVRRGDITLVAGGVYASKPRPAVVLQVNAPLLRMAIPANKTTGIDTASFIMIDKVTTVRRSNVSDPIGHLDAVQILELERRLIVFLGFAH